MDTSIILFPIYDNEYKLLLTWLPKKVCSTKTSKQNQFIFQICFVKSLAAHALKKNDLFLEKNIRIRP